MRWIRIELEVDVLPIFDFVVAQEQAGSWIILKTFVVLNSYFHHPLPWVSQLHKNFGKLFQLKNINLFYIKNNGCYISSFFYKNIIK